MGIKKDRPLSPARRFRTIVTKDEVTKRKPEKSLTRVKKSSAGRNNHGRITVRHRGGGSKRKIRLVDYKRQRKEPAKVVAIEYDPNRSANLALIKYQDGKKTYIIHPEGLKVGDTVTSGQRAPIKPGNVRPLKNIPESTIIHNIELKPGRGGAMVRSAGSEAVLMAKEGKYAQIQLTSGEVRLVEKDCKATIGKVGNSDHYKAQLGSAGASRRRGKRPKVRGMAMNSIDHPHGGGRGKSKGNHLPSNPWGKKCKGVKTRKKNKASDRLIVRRRK